MNNTIKETLTNEEITGVRITRALKFLELYQYDMAKQVVELALTQSEFIQDRMALMAVNTVANVANNSYTDKMLEIFYDVD